MDNFFISWAAPKEVHVGWYFYLGILLLLSIPLLFERQLFKRWRQTLIVIMVVGAIGGLLLLTTDVGLAWHEFVTADMDINNSSELVEGEKVYFKYGCSNCHQIGDFGIPAGPNLKEISQRMNKEELTRYMVDFDARDVDTVMPDYKEMSEKELELLLEFLARL